MARVRSTMGNSNVESNNISNSFNHFVLRAADEKPADEKQELLHWLSPLEPQIRHEDVRTDRFDDVGNWLFQKNEFREWRSREGGTERAVLFCSGEPGVGKTYISSLVIDSLYKQANEEDIAVVILYCDYQEQHKQTTANMIGSILKQLAAKDNIILESVRKAFLKAKDECGGRGLRLPDLIGILMESAISLPQVFICIDALDELLSKELPEFLASLGRVQELPNVHVFLTGRPSVETQISKHLAKVATVTISPRSHDIENYLQRKFEMDTAPNEMNDLLQAKITKKVIQGSISKSFLLISLSINAILGGATLPERTNKLSQMSKGNDLGNAYATTLERMNKQEDRRRTFGMKALMWVAYSERPLLASELCQALEVDPDCGSAPSIKTLLEWSLGLITLEKSSATIRLFHSTLRDHLFESSDLSDLSENPHSMIAEICLTYLNSESVLKLPPSPLPTGSAASLLNYASCYWEKHARWGMTENVKPLARRLLNGFGQHISSSILLIYGDYPIELWMSSPNLGQDWFRGFTCLHWTAALGMLKMTSTLLEMEEWDLNATDATGNTAIAWAARGGHTDILKKLLEQKDIDPNIADKDGRTSLSWAAWQGDKEVVNILLGQKGINLDPIHHDGRTPLLWAVARGHEEAAKLLLKHKDAVFGLTLNTVASSTQPSALPQLQFRWIRTFLSLPLQPDTPTSHTPLAIQILIDCLAISVSLSLLVFLSWIIPSSSSTILLSFHR